MIPWFLCMQNIEDTSLPFLVTLNPPHQPENMLLKWRTGHPVPSVAATKASLDLGNIQGKRGIWFCGAYQGIAQLLDCRIILSVMHASLDAVAFFL